MISREEAIDIIKQVPLYRYECELDKGRQSDLFQALNKAISDMQKLEKIEKDACEWEYINTTSYKANIQCLGKTKNIKSMKNYKFCPYCGRMIKGGGVMNDIELRIHDAKVRADAIDELREATKTSLQFHVACCIEDLNNIAEELKEKL